MSNEHDDPYRAIPCADYSQYELWVMHSQHLQLAWRDEHGKEHIGLLLPQDLLSRDGQEFLVATSIPDHKTHHIRLDRIIRCKPDET